MVHEDRFRNGVPDPPPTEPSPSRITRGEVGANTHAIDRDPRSSLRGRRHLFGEAKPLEDTLLDGRLELLQFFPCEPGCTGPATDAGHRHLWEEKLIRAVDDGVTQTRRNGWTDDDPRTTAHLCEAMLRVVELSGQPAAVGGLGLGDYKTLKAETYVRLPRRKGLIPMSQMPRHAPLVRPL